MHSVLTLLSHRPVDGLVANHADYAHSHGYRHAIVDSAHIYGERQQVLHKYHAIIAQLAAMEPQALLLRISDERDRPFRDRDRRFRQRDRSFRERDRADRKAGLALRMTS
ncbi:hypothetical protein LGN16_35080, partial [Burkholderia vietnamiensis]|nr:hypothetical protein [Burkholderia vietnamiensis]